MFVTVVTGAIVLKIYLSVSHHVLQHDNELLELELESPKTTAKLVPTNS